MALFRRISNSLTTAGILRKVASLIAFTPSAGFNVVSLTESQADPDFWQVTLNLQSKTEAFHVLSIVGKTYYDDGATQFTFSIAGTQVCQSSTALIQEKPLHIFSETLSSKDCLNIVIPDVIYFGFTMGSFVFTGGPSAIALCVGGDFGLNSKAVWEGVTAEQRDDFSAFVGDNVAHLLSQKAHLAGPTEFSGVGSPYNDGQSTGYYVPLLGNLPVSSAGNTAAYPINLIFARKAGGFEIALPTGDDMNFLKLPIAHIAHGQTDEPETALIQGVIGLPGSYIECPFFAPDLDTSLLLRVV